MLVGMLSAIISEPRATQLNILFSQEMAELTVNNLKSELGLAQFDRPMKSAAAHLPRGTLLARGRVILQITAEHC